MRWSDVDSQVGIITVRHNYSKGKAGKPKGKKPKPVGITPALATVIGELPHLDEHLLVRSDRGETGRWTPHAIQYLLEKLADMAGVPRYSPHKVRHTGGTAKARNGAPHAASLATGWQHTRLAHPLLERRDDPAQALQARDRGAGPRRPIAIHSVANPPRHTSTRALDGIDITARSLPKAGSRIALPSAGVTCKDAEGRSKHSGVCQAQLG